ncbi:50S ribosomal protein L32 [Cellulomonas sp. HZM]|uniref:50S ribosomal protein L32 n=1 Tax=Cellulomonas sp. HZM TaxID=1454010 RepID=UPI0004930F69|nr:50S ribosomal protein L32 [Cellulomonas sp. HZM]
MAAPKGRTSRSRTRHRRSRWTATCVPLATVRVDGRDVQVPHRLVNAVRRGLVTTDE